MYSVIIDRCWIVVGAVMSHPVLVCTKNYPDLPRADVKTVSTVLNIGSCKMVVKN